VRILIAEDNLVSRRMLETTLVRWQHEVFVATDGEAALNLLVSKDSPPLAILDEKMLGANEFEVCRRVRAAAAANQIVAPYIIFLTAKAEPGEVIDESIAGADDYLTKPHGTSELRARLDCGARIIELQNRLAAQALELKAVNGKLRQTEIELHNLSLSDDLTTLRNRRGFFAFAEQAYAAAKRLKQPMLLFYFDMNNLKSINDQYGHDAGSTAIISVAECLRKTFRASDVLARIGGDEFAVLATNAATDTENIMVARLQKMLDEETSSGNHPQQLSVSIGAVEVKPDGNTSLADYLRIADGLMYKDKRRKKIVRQ